MLKLRAERHQRSLQGEAKLILEEAATLKLEDAKELIEKIRAQFSGKAFSDSTTLVRRDRKR
jgi:plasmid stability protein